MVVCERKKDRDRQGERDTHYLCCGPSVCSIFRYWNTRCVTCEGQLTRMRCRDLKCLSVIKQLPNKFVAKITVNTPPPPPHPLVTINVRRWGFWEMQC